MATDQYRTKIKGAHKMLMMTNYGINEDEELCDDFDLVHNPNYVDNSKFIVNSPKMKYETLGGIEYCKVDESHYKTADDLLQECNTKPDNSIDFQIENFRNNNIRVFRTDRIDPINSEIESNTLSTDRIKDVFEKNKPLYKATNFDNPIILAYAYS